MSGKCPFHFFSRRQFLKGAGSGAGLLALNAAVGPAAEAASATHSTAHHGPHSGAHSATNAGTHHAAPAFFGERQAGITTSQQKHTYFIAFDLLTEKRSEVEQLMRDWTDVAARLSLGQAVTIRNQRSIDPEPTGAKEGDESDYKAGKSTADSGEAKGLSTSRLTITFGFGAGLFVTSDGRDRYGLGKYRPSALVDMPKFHGDELVAEKTGGDLSVQACSDDPQVAFHAVRQLARTAEGIAKIRWMQSGFASGAAAAGSTAGSSETPRNLMGFKDGTQQPKPSSFESTVWVGAEGPEWMRGGTYMVTRRIRIALEHWDRTDVEFQEQVIGRKKDSGAPLGQKHEKEALNLAAKDREGNSIIPENSHVRLASAEANAGKQMLRRGYSYNDGVNFTAERWPPWNQGLEYDAGLFFVSYQTDPRTGFIPIFQNMAKLDALNQFVTHVGSGLFACPPGIKKGEHLGQKLFAMANAETSASQQPVS